MRTQRGLQLTLMVVLLATAPMSARGQSHLGGMAGNGGMPSGSNPAMPMAAAPSQFSYGNMPAYGPANYQLPYAAPPGMPGYGGAYPAMYTPEGMPPQAFPAGPTEPCPPDYGMQMAGYGDPADICQNCGGGGCPDCLGIGGCIRQGLSGLLPFSDGGICAPRWYDITVEGLYLTRDETSRRIDFTSAGILGDIVLSTDNLDFDGTPAVSFTGAVQAFVGGTLEFTYLGLNNWSTSAAVTDPTDDLFSVFSEFGVNPLQGFDETDRSRLQSLSYSSSIDSFELFLRKRWQGANCRLQGSWLAGVRYVYLLEDFQYFTLGGDDDPVLPDLQSRGQMTYDVRTKNSLTGFQAGGDLWTTVIPGIHFGGELKGGVYGNYGQQGTHIVATTTDPIVANEANEADSAADVAFVGQGNITLVYKTSPNWAVRGGYTFLFLDGIALAPENFNTVVPFSTARRVEPLNDNGNVLLHGFTAGLEWMW